VYKLIIVVQKFKGILNLRPPNPSKNKYSKAPPHRAHAPRTPHTPNTHNSNFQRRRLFSTSEPFQVALPLLINRMQNAIKKESQGASQEGREDDQAAAAAAASAVASTKFK
jgi:hypothetical protein